MAVRKKATSKDPPTPPTSEPAHEKTRELTAEERASSARVGNWAIRIAVAVMALFLLSLFAGAGGWLFSSELRILATARQVEESDSKESSQAPTKIEGIIRCLFGPLGNKEEPQQIDICGIVQYDAQAVNKASVSAVVLDGNGGIIWSKATETCEQGKFRMCGPASPPPAAVLLHATKSTLLLPSPTASLDIYFQREDAGKRTLSVESLRWTSMLVVLLIFAASLLLALASWTKPSQTPQLHDLQSFAWPRIQYYCSLTLACALSLTMVWAFGTIMRQVDATNTPNNVLNLGFASIFKSSYVPGDCYPQWLFSLTSRESICGGEADGNVAGFGAPLWVLFLAAIGAALLTLTLVVNEIAKPPKFNPDQFDELARRMREFVRYGFFVLSSPISGMFVYQILVASGAAKTNLVVAFAALGTGPLIGPLLVMATQQAATAIQSHQDDPKKKENGNRNSRSDPADATTKA